ncbi:MAG: single-stranded DNA-binding protein [Bryobacteraceae bacterium]
MALNKVMLIGHLGRDPEVKTLPNGQTVGNFSVATNENFTDKAGNRQEHVEWHQVVVFGRLAETCGKYLAKGRQVYVEGRLRTREYESANGGGKQRRTEIIALRVQFLGTAPEPGAVTGGEGEEDIPF